jgi:hypothetical protein
MMLIVMDCLKNRKVLSSVIPSHISDIGGMFKLIVL